VERPTSTLDELVARIQQRYGARAAQRGAAMAAPAPPPVIATGFSALDAALPDGGIPRGRLTTIVGPRSAGATTLALTLIAQAQFAGDLACMLDLSHTFAPVAAVTCGVSLADIAVARPADGDAATLAVATLLARRAVGVLVIDSLPAWMALPRGPAALATLLPRLPRLLAASGCALIVLHPLPTGLLSDPPALLHMLPAPITALRLRLAHQGWLQRGPQIVGCRTAVRVLTPPFDHAYATAMVEIDWAEALLRLTYRTTGPLPG
jgi:recombination protein RecA